MPFSFFNCKRQELLRAQQQVVAAGEHIILSQQLPHAVRESVQARLSRLQYPIEPMERLQVLLSTTISALSQLLTQQTTMLSQELGEARRDRDHWRRVAEEFARHPLQEEIARLTQARDQWRTIAEQNTQRVRELEAAMTRSEQIHRDEAARLATEIAALNRLVVQQQDELLGKE